MRQALRATFPVAALMVAHGLSDGELLEVARRRSMDELARHTPAAGKVLVL